MLAFRFVHALALAIWLGSMVGLGALAAPATFQVLQVQVPSGGRALAGAVFGEVLRRYHPVAYLCGLALVASLVAMALVGPRPRVFWVRLAIAGLMLILTLYSGFVVSARIERLQATLGAPVSSLAPEDERRAQFGRLHAASTGLMVATAIGALLLLFFEARDSVLQLALDPEPSTHGPLLPDQSVQKL
jgi:hypothetical protein